MPRGRQLLLSSSEGVAGGAEGGGAHLVRCAQFHFEDNLRFSIVPRTCLAWLTARQRGGEGRGGEGRPAASFEIDKDMNVDIDVAQYEWHQRGQWLTKT